MQSEFPYAAWIANPDGRYPEVVANAIVLRRVAGESAIAIPFQGIARLCDAAAVDFILLDASDCPRRMGDQILTWDASARVFRTVDAQR